MRNSFHKRFLQDDSAAIGPLYALSLFGLITVAGVGWDYSRMMTMDSELQNAADQAALAAATQLNGSEGAMVRARDAANNYLANSASDWVNETRLSDDGDGRAITSLSFNFFDDYDRATDTFGTEITNDDNAADAAVVMVTVNGREVFFALTAVVGAISSSGDIAANAVAGQDNAVCNVPPLMFCAPSGSSDFPTPGDIGKAINLHEGPSGEEWAPGNFDYLNIDYVGLAPSDSNLTLGYNSSLFGCSGEALESRPGNRTTEMKAFNTRFDEFQNPAGPCEPASGNFCPAENVRRNQVRVESRSYPGNGIDANGVYNPDLSGMTCDASGNGSWEDIEDINATYRPNDQGLPLDTCQITGGCPDPNISFGDGLWDISGYFVENHTFGDIGSVPDLDSNGKISRYEVYEWEIDDNRLSPRLVGSQPSNGNKIEIFCSYPQPTEGTPVIASATQKDRRAWSLLPQSIAQGFTVVTRSISSSGSISSFLPHPELKAPTNHSLAR